MQEIVVIGGFLCYGGCSRALQCGDGAEFWESSSGTAQMKNSPLNCKGDSLLPYYCTTTRFRANRVFTSSSTVPSVWR